MTHLLGTLSVRAFLARHWQKRPLLVRGAFPDGPAPLTPTQLFELAGEADVTSRLVFSPTQDRSWEVRPGPFSAAELQQLPPDGWTLLVQEADRRVDELARLLDRFRFIPNWRIDDVMVSYAPDGGGVGPHLDRYDVFLIQAAGRRRWRIASRPLVAETHLCDTPLPVLAEFDPDREWVLEAGDMLYLPPRIAHEGVALGQSLTCSVGFRAPDPRELCAGFLRQLPPRAFDEIRFADPDLEPTESVGEISPEARRRLRESARGLFAGSSGFDRWLGRFVTTPRRSDQPGARARTLSLAELEQLLGSGGVLRRSAAPHFAWQREEDGVVQLFVGGESYELEAGAETTAELLCGRDRLDGPALESLVDQEAFAAIVLDLILRGFLVPEPPGSPRETRSDAP